MKNASKLFTLILLCFLLTGCADSVTFVQAENIEPVGFWFGLWHGIIFPLAWIWSLFSDGIAIYAIYNNGGWYDFGFFIGVGGFSASLISIDWGDKNS